MCVSVFLQYYTYEQVSRPHPLCKLSGCLINGSVKGLKNRFQKWNIHLFCVNMNCQFMQVSQSVLSKINEGLSEPWCCTADNTKKKKSMALTYFLWVCLCLCVLILLLLLYTRKCHTIQIFVLCELACVFVLFSVTEDFLYYYKR